MLFHFPDRAERLLRQAVLWRQRSSSLRSPAGGRFVERILTVVQTRRLRGERVVDYLPGRPPLGTRGSSFVSNILIVDKTPHSSGVDS